MALEMLALVVDMLFKIVSDLNLSTLITSETSARSEIASLLDETVWTASRG